MAMLDDLRRVPVAAVARVLVVAHGQAAVAPDPVAAVARVPVVADVPVGMAASVAADGAVVHHSRRRALSAKRCAQRGQ